MPIERASLAAEAAIARVSASARSEA